MKQLWKIVIIALLISSFYPSNTASLANGQEQLSKRHQLTLILNTRQLYQEGSMYLAPRPHIVTDGITYVSLRTIANRLGYSVFYNPANREIEVVKGENRLTVIQNEGSYKFNGVVSSFRNESMPYVIEGTFMIPLRDVVQLFNVQVTPKLSENKVELVWFETIKISEPVVINELYPIFETNKVEYKIGETIHYIDASYAIGSPIVSRQWSNNKNVFFEPGPKEIKLEVTNKDGEKKSTSRTIYVSEEVMFTKAEYDLKYTAIGEKMSINRDEVLTYPVVPFQLKEEPFTLVRSNSPEKINQEGFYYQDNLQGDTRFLIHHQNARPNPVRIYLIATNNGKETATVTVNNFGMFGPVRYVSATGKNSVANYLTSLKQKRIINTVSIEPNRTEILIAEVKEKSIPTDHVLTMYADVFASHEVTYQIVILDEANDLYETLPHLQRIKATRDGKHSRGTFKNGNREIIVDQLIGNEKSRIIIGDGKEDFYVTGTDRLSNLPETNYGNRGVLYNLELTKVASNTALVLNPRGGHYAGAFIVNGNVVVTPINGILENPNETVVLYRTGKKEEKVTIQFIPASGSNLPLNILALPMK